MKKFSLFVIAALLGTMTASAQTGKIAEGPIKGVKAETFKKMAQAEEWTIERQTKEVLRQNSLERKAAARVSEDDVIVDIPDPVKHENMILSYDGTVNSWFGVQTVSATGAACTLIEGTDGEIWIKDLTFGAGFGTWVSAQPTDKENIYVIHPQDVYVSGTYTYRLVKMSLYSYYDEEDDAEYVTFGYDEDDADIEIYWDGKVLRTTDEWNANLPIQNGEFVEGGVCLGVWADGGEDGEGWSGYTNWNINAKTIDDDPAYALNELPEGLEVKTYTMTYKNATGKTGEDQVIKEFVKVAIDESTYEVYIKTTDAAPGWIKGTIYYANTGQGYAYFVRIPTSQYLGFSEQYGYHFYELAATMYTLRENEVYYDWGFLNKEFIDMPIDMWDYTITAHEGEGIIINAAPDRLYYLDYLKAPKFEEFVETAEVPADIPYFYVWNGMPYGWYYNIYGPVPVESVDGTPLLPAKLYNVVYFDGDKFDFNAEYGTDFEVATELPYEFNDGYDLTFYNGDWRDLYFYFEPAETVGIQSVYYGDGVRNVSNVTVYNVADGSEEIMSEDQYTGETTGVENVKNSTVASVSYSDAAGRQVTKNSKGFMVKTVTYTDGSQKSYKVVRK